MKESSDVDLGFQIKYFFPLVFSLGLLVFLRPNHFSLSPWAKPISPIKPNVFPLSFLPFLYTSMFPPHSLHPTPNNMP
jgi:hypothetical protein